MADQPTTIIGTTSANDIALELWKALRFTHGPKNSVEEELELFQQCRKTVLTRSS